MIVVDLNILIDAVNRDSEEHRAAKAWLEDALGGDDIVGFPWVVLLGFVRLTTNRRILPNALRLDQALEVVDSWMAQPRAIALSAGDNHWAILRDLLAGAGAGGNLTIDAHLAALAIENGAELCSTDGDFARFRQLRWRNPLTIPR